MRVLIVGGTGFIGYHAAHTLAQRGHEVTVLGLPPGPPEGTFPDTVTVALNNIGLLADKALDGLLRGFESVVFAAGADDRIIPQSPAARFFYEANIKSAVRLTAAALRAGVQRFVLLGSYFTHFDRVWPHMKLAEHHPYIESRKQQQELCTTIAGSDMALVALELPYIFGSMPGVIPLWAPLINYVRSNVPLYYTNGGSNMVSVESVAQAVAGACEYANESRIFQVGDRNVKWNELLQRLCEITGRANDTVHILPDSSLNKVSWLMDAVHAIQGKEAGLHAAHFPTIQTACAFFDIQESKQALGYEVGGLEASWRETVAACPEESAPGRWKKLSERARQFIHKA